MKKILAFLLVLCMIFSVATLVGCDSKDSGKNKNNASDKDDDDEDEDDGGDDKTPSGGGEGSLYEMVSAAIEKTLKAKLMPPI